MVVSEAVSERKKEVKAPEKEKEEAKVEEAKVVELLDELRPTMEIVAGRWQKRFKEDLVCQFQMELISQIQKGKDPTEYPRSYWFRAFNNSAIDYLRSERYEKVSISISLSDEEGEGFQFEASADTIEDTYLNELVGQVKQMVSSKAGELLNELVAPSGKVQEIAEADLKVRKARGGQRAKTVRINRSHLATILEVSMTELSGLWEELKGAVISIGLVAA